MKLYFSPGTCSLAPHIVLIELNLNYDKVQVNLREGRTLSGLNFHELNPKDYVPMLELDNGERLTEGVAIMQFLADSKPQSNLISPITSFNRYREIEMLNFISTEIHKGYSPLFNAHKSITSKESLEELHTSIRRLLGKRFSFLDSILSEKEFICGDHFTVCDAYLFTVLSWGKFVKINIGDWTNLSNYFSKLLKRESIKKAIEVEKLKM